MLVLPGSLGTTRELWEPQLEPLSPTRSASCATSTAATAARRCRPAPTRSAELAGDALALLDELGARARLLAAACRSAAWSGMWLGANAPERLDSLVLACTSSRVPRPPRIADRAALVRERGIEPIADAVVARWFTAETMRARPELPAPLPRAARRPAGRGLRRLLRGARRLGLRGRARPRRGADARARRRRGRGDAAGDTDLLAERIPARGSSCSTAPRISPTSSGPREFAAAALAHLQEAAA